MKRCGGKPPKLPVESEQSPLKCPQEVVQRLVKGKREYPEVRKRFVNGVFDLTDHSVDVAGLRAIIS